LDNSQQALGARLIARCLKDMGLEMEERTVRYHLRIMDERGLTKLVRRRDGRMITERGHLELKHALVNDKVGLAMSKIETLSFRTDFNADTLTGSIPVNISFFPRAKFKKALRAMKPAFEAKLCVSDLVAFADAGEIIGDLVVPEGMVGLATVCSIVINGTLLKAGIPINSKFGGVLQIRDNIPHRFVELIHYTGSSMDPSEIFIRARMTTVGQVRATGNGEILANFREIPADCQPLTIAITEKLEKVGIGGILLMGNVSAPVCEIPVDVNRIGIVIIGGLNPVAAAQEADIEIRNHAMSAMVEYKNLVKFAEVYDERS